MDDAVGIDVFYKFVIIFIVDLLFGMFLEGAVHGGINAVPVERQILLGLFTGDVELFHHVIEHGGDDGTRKVFVIILSAVGQCRRVEGDAVFPDLITVGFVFLLGDEVVFFHLTEDQDRPVLIFGRILLIGLGEGVIHRRGLRDSGKIGRFNDGQILGGF